MYFDRCFWLCAKDHWLCLKRSNGTVLQKSMQLFDYLFLFVRLDSTGGGGVNITGGPLQYQHRAEALFLHWGRGQGGSGSEHSINHMSWAGEIQIYGYNTQLYSNLSQVMQ